MTVILRVIATFAVALTIVAGCVAPPLPHLEMPRSASASSGQ